MIVAEACSGECKKKIKCFKESVFNEQSGWKTVVKQP